METKDILEIIGLILDMVGTLLIAYAALAVHHRFRHEHQVDDAVFSAMNREEKFAIVGVLGVISGFLLTIIARFVL